MCRRAVSPEGDRIFSLGHTRAVDSPRAVHNGSPSKTSMIFCRVFERFLQLHRSHGGAKLCFLGVRADLFAVATTLRPLPRQVTSSRRAFTSCEEFNRAIEFLRPFRAVVTLSWATPNFFSKSYRAIKVWKLFPSHTHAQLDLLSSCLSTVPGVGLFRHFTSLLVSRSTASAQVVLTDFGTETRRVQQFFLALGGSTWDWQFRFLGFLKQCPPQVFPTRFRSNKLTPVRPPPSTPVIHVFALHELPNHNGYLHRWFTLPRSSFVLRFNKFLKIQVCWFDVGSFQIFFSVSLQFNLAITFRFTSGHFPSGSLPA